ncbi:MAG: pyridoxamine 5'-phosphate oxidase family protein [Bacteroidetes bacterium]|nr:pyridoxamine 5'-phosphate oxidase family protein [Bacteroidota bacterium]MBS1976784.1 pyridoxamine 5'-phosphate oxidase family protein [Bacteroidota bacterium]
MVGKLSPAQIDTVLQQQSVCRIGCSANGKIFVVPISYALEGKYLYCHSREGLKIKLMRKNHNVCVEVDAIDNMMNWRSVILWGSYEELKSESSRRKGMKILMNKFMPLMTSESLGHMDAARSPEVVEKHRQAIVFRIKVEDKTGMFEKG